VTVCTPVVPVQASRGVLWACTYLCRSRCRLVTWWLTGRALWTNLDRNKVGCLLIVSCVWMPLCVRRLYHDCLFSPGFVHSRMHGLKHGVASSIIDPRRYICIHVSNNMSCSPWNQWSKFTNFCKGVCACSRTSEGNYKCWGYRCITGLLKGI